jgi:tripartite-type tricarboxylate transporter receptor subunit TctC
MEKRRSLLALLAALLVTLGLGQSARAQQWPQRPVRIVVPYAAGGNTDTIARIISERLSDTFGRQFVVENKPGAAGAIAADAVARSPADGYTLLMATLGEIAIVPAVTKTPYDPSKDFVPISNIGTNPFVLVVHPGIPATTVAELVAYARRQPEKMTYVAIGAGSLIHLSTAMFLKQAGLEMTPVMYKGGTAPLSDVIAGHVNMFLANLSVVLPHATSGAVRLLAVTSDKRAPQIPNVPTFAEAGYPATKSLLWTGLMAPAGTPKEIVEQIAREVKLAVRDAKIAERLVIVGVEPLGSSPQEFAAMIAADIPFWSEAARTAGVQGQ